MDPIGISWNKTFQVDWIWSLVRIPLGDFCIETNGGGIDWWKWEKDVKDKVSVLYPPRN